MRRFLISVFSSMIIMIFCACGSQASDDNFAFENLADNQYNLTSNIYENGSFYIDLSKKCAYYLDFSSMELVPLCNKPNCMHNDETCLSYICLQDSWMTVAYQDGLFWFESTCDIVESADGRSTSAAYDTICYRGDLNTGEVEKFANIPDVYVADAQEIVISGDTLYVIGCQSAVQQEDGTWVEYSNCGDQYLYALNLDTAEVENYGLINDASTAYYNWIANGIMYTEVDLTGVYQNKLYMSYRYVDNLSDITDYIDSKDAEAPDWSDALDVIPYHRVNKCLNLETMEIEESSLPAADVIQDNHYIYYENNQYYVMDEVGNVATSSLMFYDDAYAPNTMTFVNGILWKGVNNLCFNPETKTDFYIDENYQNKMLIVLAYYEGDYVIQYRDETGEICFDKVSESDLIQKA